MKHLFGKIRSNGIEGRIVGYLYSPMEERRVGNGECAVIRLNNSLLNVPLSLLEIREVESKEIM